MIQLRHFFSNALHGNPRHALKTSLTIGSVVIPCALCGYPLWGVSLSLGVLAAALSDYDEHPRAKLGGIVISTVLFFFSSAVIALTLPLFWLCGVILVPLTLFLVFVGGLGARFKSLTSGALLAVTYTMLGYDLSSSWYSQPILLSLGGFSYGLVSLILLLLNPWQPVKQELSMGYAALGAYLLEKSKLFPSTIETQGTIRNQLAVLNINIIVSLEKIRELLVSYSDAHLSDRTYNLYYRQFILLQNLHERALSSHERYDILSVHSDSNTSLLDGFGIIIEHMGHAFHKISQHYLSDEKSTYSHTTALDWMISALSLQINTSQSNAGRYFDLLLSNLEQMNVLMHSFAQPHQAERSQESPRLLQDKRRIISRFRDQLDSSHPRFRYGVQLALCFFIGYFLQHVLLLEKGGWVLLTSLIVCQPGYSETARKLYQRVSGTVLGVIAGGMLLSLLPTTSGHILLLILSAFYFIYFLSLHYAVAVIFVTIFVLAAFQIGFNQGESLLIPRVFDTLTGAALTIVVVRFVWPDWQHKKLSTLLQKALATNIEYFNQILSQYRSDIASDTLEYRVARRYAHIADNALATSWRNMQLEPKEHRFLSHDAFKSTYLNHALLSYLSALGAHRHGGSLDPEVLSLATQCCTQLSLLGKKQGERKEDLMRLRDLICHTRELADGKTLQQVTLLYNIVDVTLQMADASTSLTTS